MHFNYLTLYPKMFPGFLGYSLMGKALEKGLWSYDTINIRDFATDNYKTVDDAIKAQGLEDQVAKAQELMANGTSKEGRTEQSGDTV